MGWHLYHHSIATSADLCDCKIARIQPIRRDALFVARDSRYFEVTKLLLMLCSYYYTIVKKFSTLPFQRTAVALHAAKRPEVRFDPSEHLDSIAGAFN